MPVESLLNRIRFDEGMRNRIVSWRVQEPIGGSYVDIPDDIHPELRRALSNLGIEKLYSHQYEAYHKVRDGRNVLIVTPTASGKSLAYNLPVLQGIIKNPDARAFYLFPTKALSQDQVAGLNQLLGQIDFPIPAHTYDGDTPRDIRNTIRLRGRIVVTNPDMLHKAILPHHHKWVHVLENLKFIVIDEIHAYRGVFGSHVANVFRRLNRILRYYGAEPVFIATTATIRNPAEHIEKLTKRKFEVITNNGAPRGRKHFLIWNPPVVNRELGLRGNYLRETENIASLLISEGVKSIAFARSRLNVEILGENLRKRFGNRPDRLNRIVSYRGGYLPKERRKIEKGLRNDEIDLVVSTNALELGIDIGSLDASVIAGFPGTISSLLQQWGRAGRKSSESIAILVTSSSPLDQFIAHNPEYISKTPPERALINPDNLLILLAHIKCSAYELPFREGEKFGDKDISPFLEFLEEHGLIYKKEGTYHWTSEQFPADEFSLRTVTEENFVVVDQTTSKPVIIGEVDFHSAPVLLHDQAIYLHQGKQYQVKKLDYTNRKAFVEEVNVEYYTDAVDYTKVKVLETFEEKVPGEETVYWGEVLVSRKVVGFKKVRFSTFENVGFGKVNLPEDEMHTQAYWIKLDKEFLEKLGLSKTSMEFGLWGILHLLKGIAPIYLMCDPHDLGVHLGDPSGRYYSSPERKLLSLSTEDSIEERTIERSGYDPHLFIYETYPGGVGLAEELFQIHGQLLQSALEHLRACKCEKGCPSCVGPYGYDTKGTALLILSSILES